MTGREYRNNNLKPKKMEKTLEFTQYGGGRYACTFTAAGGKSLIQVIRQKQGLIYIEAGADTEHLTYLESAGRFKDVLCEIEVPAETVVRVVSHTPVEYAAYMAGEEGKSGDYYTKEEVDRMMASVTQLQADWNQTDPQAANYIKGKPTLVERLEDLSDVEISPVDMSQQNYFEDAAEDYDGNLYDAVIIGEQVWLAQNLKVTHFNDGTPIDILTADAVAAAGYTDTGGYAYPNNDPTMVERYGLLYPIYTNRGMKRPSDEPTEKEISPIGWHLPSKEEWDAISSLGVQLYSDNNADWTIDSSNFSNATRLTLVPSGEASFGWYGSIFPAISDFGERIILMQKFNTNNYAVIGGKNYGLLRTDLERENTRRVAIRCVCDLTATEFRAKMGKRATKGQHLEFDGEIWRNKNTGLPDVTESDNGKILTVDNGTWKTGEPHDNRIPEITTAQSGYNNPDWGKIPMVSRSENSFDLGYPEDRIIWYGLCANGQGIVNFMCSNRHTCVVLDATENFALRITFTDHAENFLLIRNTSNNNLHFTLESIQTGSVEAQNTLVTKGVLENGVDVEAGGACAIRATHIADRVIIDVMNQPVANPNFTHTANTTVSDPTATITFPAYRRCTQMITVSADLGVTLEVNNLSDNYLWIKNNSNSDVDITVTAVTHGGNSVSNIYMPADGIIVPANGVCEMGILVNTDGAFISSRNDLTLQQ